MTIEEYNNLYKNRNYISYNNTTNIQSINNNRTLNNISSPYTTYSANYINTNSINSNNQSIQRI